MRSSPPSSSATTPRSAAGRSSWAAASSWPRATRPAPGASARPWAGRRPGGAARRPSSCRPRWSAYSEASRAVFDVFDRTAPVVERLSIDEAFLDVRGLGEIAGAPAEVAAALRRAVREDVGLPITVGVARTRVLAKVASGVAKPDGLLVVPPGGERAFLDPLAVERLWGVGPATAAAPARPRDRPGRPARAAGGGDARHAPRALGGSSGPRAGPRRRSAAGPARARPALGGVAVRARPRRRARPRPSTPSSSGSWTGSRAGCAPAGRAGRTVVLRLRFDDFSRATRSHTLPAATAASRPVLAAARALLAAARPAIERRGLTLVGIAVTGLERDRGAVQLSLPLDGPGGARSTTSSTTCASASARRRSPGRRCSAATASRPASARSDGGRATIGSCERGRSGTPPRDAVLPGGAVMRAWARRVAHGGLAAVAAVALLLAALAVPASATDRYALVHGCYVLRAPNGGVRRQGRARATAAAAATPAAATPLRMQATALGRYLLYGPDATMPARRRRSARSRPPTAPGPAADWTLTATAAGFTPHRALHRQRPRGRPRRAPGQVPAASATAFALVAAHGLRAVPRGPGQRDRHAVQGREPDRAACAASSTTTSTSAPSTSSAAASTAGGRGAPTASRWPCGLPRPPAQRRRRRRRELLRHRHPGRHPRHRRLADASPAGRARSR